MRVRSLHAATICILTAVVLSGTGCAYLQDRLADAKDIPYLMLGWGAGARVRVGPLPIGLHGAVDWGGFRQRWWAFAPVPFKGVFHAYDWDLLVGFEEEFPYGEDGILQRRGKAYQTRYIPVRVHPYFSKSPFALTGDGPHFDYYTQLEVTVGLILNVRMGINPGEAVDFLLGWFGVDLFRDDISAGKGLL